MINQRSNTTNASILSVDFEKLGIGGMDRQLKDMLRRAFVSRAYPPHVVKRLGIIHVKGMLLYGPPGTGKTLIARNIGKLFSGKEPKIVNGPELLNKCAPPRPAPSSPRAGLASRRQSVPQPPCACHCVLESATSMRRLLPRAGRSFVGVPLLAAA